MAKSGEHRFVIEPFKGVGPIRFGMHKDEVSHAFTYVYSSFFKTRESKVRADHCTVVGLIMHYDAGSRVNYIEIVKPVHGSVTLELFGRGITGISLRGLMQFLKSRSVTVEKNYYGCDCPTIGLNTYNSDGSEDKPIECFGLYADGAPPAALY